MTHNFSPIQTGADLQSALDYIAEKSQKLAKLVLGNNKPIDTICIFAHSDDEYQTVAGLLRTYGAESELSHGLTLYIDARPILSINGQHIKLLGVRRPDPAKKPQDDRPEIGYGDYPVSDDEYAAIKATGITGVKEITTGLGRSLLELRHPGLDVRGYIADTGHLLLPKTRSKGQRMTDPIFITGNQHKADFLAKYLGIPLKHHKLDLDEIQSLDLHVVVEHKARQAYELLQKPVLVEDAGLVFTALGRLPGTFVKWFIEEIGYEGLLRLANGLPEQTAVGRVCYGVFDGHEMRFFDGEMRGRIAEESRDGGRGFGFDPIFINDGFNKTRAEMTEAEYAESSYRTVAMEQLRIFLTN